MRRWWLWLALAAALVILWAMLYPQLGSKPARGVHHAVSEVRLLWHALEQYRAEYDELPPPLPATVFQALCGENAHKMVFLDLVNEPRGPSGELLDPWGSPYQFDLSDPAEPHVWSYGPNKRDERGAEGSDDLASWHH